MTMNLTLLALQKQRPDAKIVLWSRIDQRSCFKSICLAGLEPIIINTVQINDEQTTNLEEFEALIASFGADNICCILSTTSCFAPRACDDVEELAIMAKFHNIPHIINNAYGLQSTAITHKIEQAYKKGRVDVFIQSTDKNLMVPVGGCIIASFDKKIVEDISNMYAGRASSSPALNAFVTILAMGKNKYLELMKNRKEQFKYMKGELEKLALKHSEKVFETKANPISIAFSLQSIPESQATLVGSMLYKRGKISFYHPIE